MVLHWAEVNPFVFIWAYLGHDSRFERMSYPSGYVSCFRFQGEQILPPILTDEERQQCQTYKQQAINVEKKIQERRLLKAKQLESVQEELSQCEDENTSSAEMEVLEFIRKALGDSNDLEEVKLLISQVGEELQKRRSFGSRDSTFNDIDSISLNQSTDLYNLEAASNYFDKLNLNESAPYVSHADLQSVSKNYDVKHTVSEGNIFEHVAIENPKVVFEPEEPSPEFSSITNQLPFDEVTSESSRNPDQSPFDEVTLESSRNSNQLMFDEVPESLLPESKKLSNSFNEKVSPAKSTGCEETTPPKLIRSNSYTLDSPSPSVLMYLRSLALENSSEKVEISNKVIKNLNNFWKDEEPKESSLLTAVSEMENGVENVESDNSDKEENNYCTIINNKVSPLKNPDEQNGHYTHFNNKVSLLSDVSNEIDEEKGKAAMIIQAAARGFLVRRLMKTQKIKDLKVIIKEAVLCAWNLYGEQAVSPADVQLHERIIQQVTAACYELHSIFCNWSTTDRMALIKSDREKLKYPKPKFRPSRDRKVSESNSVSSSTRSKSASSVSAMSRSSTPKELHRPTTLPSALRKNIRNQAWK
ncbi:uncharacterized protein Cp110 isoform X2 [Halyomorpha halys]|uniref:uncharacterized protein Cp110 isoform X2 n=1 Tax=Halyomorpha halys TaxID=286706 RepID=UPI0034D2A83F